MRLECQSSRQRIVTLKTGFFSEDLCILAMAENPWLVIILRPNNVRSGLGIDKQTETEVLAGVGLQREILCFREVSRLKTIFSVSFEGP